MILRLKRIAVWALILIQPEQLCCAAFCGPCIPPRPKRVAKCCGCRIKRDAKPCRIPRFQDPGSRSDAAPLRDPSVRGASRRAFVTSPAWKCTDCKACCEIRPPRASPPRNDSDAVREFLSQPAISPFDCQQSAFAPELLLQDDLLLVHYAFALDHSIRQASLCVWLK